MLVVPVASVVRVPRAPPARRASWGRKVVVGELSVRERGRAASLSSVDPKLTRMVPVRVVRALVVRVTAPRKLRGPAFMVPPASEAALFGVRVPRAPRVVAPGGLDPTAAGDGTGPFRVRLLASSVTLSSFFSNVVATVAVKVEAASIRTSSLKSSVAALTTAVLTVVVPTASVVRVPRAEPAVLPTAPLKAVEGEAMVRLGARPTAESRAAKVADVVPVSVVLSRLMMVRSPKARTAALTAVVLMVVVPAASVVRVPRAEVPPIRPTWPPKVVLGELRVSERARAASLSSVD